MKIDLDELEKLAKNAIDIREATKHWTGTKRVHSVPTPETVLELIRQIRIMREALESIYIITKELQPNSGHMYLSDINSIYKTSNKALEQVEETK